MLNTAKWMRTRCQLTACTSQAEPVYRGKGEGGVLSHSHKGHIFPSPVLLDAWSVPGFLLDVREQR